MKKSYIYTSLLCAFFVASLVIPTRPNPPSVDEGNDCEQTLGEYDLEILHPPQDGMWVDPKLVNPYNHGLVLDN